MITASATPVLVSDRVDTIGSACSKAALNSTRSELTRPSDEMSMVTSGKGPKDVATADELNCISFSFASALLKQESFKQDCIAAERGSGRGSFDILATLLSEGKMSKQANSYARRCCSLTFIEVSAELRLSKLDFN